MIRPRYALKLARTKLRSKRGILVASIIVSSLLFAALIAAIIVFQGAQKSAVRFVEAANNEQYLVSVKPNIPQSVTNLYEGGSLQLSPETIRTLKAFEKEYYAAERAKYEAADVEYNEALEVPALKPSIIIDPKVPEDQRVMLDYSSPVLDAFLAQRFNEYAKTAQNKFDDLKKLGAQYGAMGYYTQGSSMLSGLPALRVVQNGKEDFGTQYINEAQLMTADKNAVHNGIYSFVDEQLLKRHLATAPTELRGIPVIPAAQEITKLFGEELSLPAEPRNEEGSEKVHTAWLQKVQEAAVGFTYQACYRNATEQQLIEKIQRDYSDMEMHKDDVGYQKPTLLYQLPTEACGDITVQSDTRSTEEKQATQQFEDGLKRLGTYEAPAHRLLTFQIVGVSYAEPYIYSPTNATDFTKGLLSGTADTLRGMSTPIPRQLYQSLPNELKFDDLTTSARGRTASVNNEDFAQRIVAFRTIDEARRFISDVGCPERYDGTECPKLFYTSPYGSNYLLLDDMAKAFVTVLGIAFPVVLGFALVIIWFTMSRMMAENRKETAVYRAMGARRGDIVAIYITYTLLVAVRIALVSLGVGIAAAFIVDLVYAPHITATAASMFGMVSSAPTVSLFDSTSPAALSLVGAVVGLIFVVGLIASIQPLVRNVLRPPVRDMRSE